MTITYEDIREHHEANNSASQIAALLDEDFRRSRDISASDLDDLLGLSTLVFYRDGDNNWAGPLRLIMNSPETFGPLAYAVKQLATHLTKPDRSAVKTTDSQFSKVIGGLIGSLSKLPEASFAESLAVTGFSSVAELVDYLEAEIDRLSGGYRFAKPANVTEIQSMIDELAKMEVVQDCRDAMAAELQTGQAKSTSVNGWLDVLDTDALTLAEVQTYCDELLASDEGKPLELANIESER